MLDGAAKLRRPVHLEIDPETRIIRRLLLPDVSRIPALRKHGEDSLDVLLEMSHAIRTLRKSAQKNPNAALTDTEGTCNNWIWSQPDDPGYADTNYWLAFYRHALRSRSIRSGPPPYANCP